MNRVYTVDVVTVEEDCIGLRIINGAAPELSDTLDNYITCRRRKTRSDIMKNIEAGATKQS